MTNNAQDIFKALAAGKHPMMLNTQTKADIRKVSLSDKPLGTLIEDHKAQPGQVTLFS